MLIVLLEELSGLLEESILIVKAVPSFYAEDEIESLLTTEVVSDVV